MKYCNKCGTQLEDDMAFCTQCGAPCNDVQNTAGPVYQQERNDIPYNMDTPGYEQAYEPVSVKQDNKTRIIGMAVVGGVALIVLIFLANWLFLGKYSSPTKVVKTFIKAGEDLDEKTITKCVLPEAIEEDEDLAGLDSDFAEMLGLETNIKLDLDYNIGERDDMTDKQMEDYLDRYDFEDAGIKKLSVVEVSIPLGLLGSQDINVVTAKKKGRWYIVNMSDASH